MPLLAAICSPLQGSSCKYASLLTLGSVSQAEGRRFAATQPQALGQLRWPANSVTRSMIPKPRRGVTRWGFFVADAPIRLVPRGCRSLEFAC